MHRLRLSLSRPCVPKRSLARLSMLAVLGFCLLVPWVRPATAETLSHGRFERVQIYRPVGPVKHVVLFLSGEQGWNRHLAGMASPLVKDGALVVGIDSPKLLAALEADGSNCVFPDGDLENLSHFVQAYYKLPTYFTPLLVGYSSGATLAYAMLAQAPPSIFAGAVSLSFCAELRMRKPMCVGDALHFTARKDGDGVRLIPASRLHAPWIVLQGSLDAVCPASDAHDFVSQTHPARFVDVPKAGHEYGNGNQWLAPYRSAYTSILEAEPQRLPAPPTSLSDLPIIEVPPTGKAETNDTFAILLSGDGGWAGLDKEVAGSLAARGVPVAGVDSLRYFWRARTPQGLAQDVDRMLRYYAFQWKKQRAMLIGYSQGADVLPFAVNRLPDASRDRVALSVLIGISKTASFEFHVSHWIGSGADGLPVEAETNKLSADDTLCLYGDDDDESLCPTIGATHARVMELQGGHHFGGDYHSIAELILSQLRRR
jgi:type IV secretory pathway VirJ component